uniref:Uncharacterized protein n=1 Tax=Candidatus Kentrum sp. TUN TaxID=2126343 RepID=A0A450ZTA4_9GAMM|nr:MAG: hypothetical protein BECKTUN1418F_GA0071002_11022 [Candidatus Kentron sp. TUN]VFK59852.1 MAG: hypothetical protein BECKTUN1418D_GA0071000_11102 [Candidatus Kentron sp. TUN]
MLVIEANRIDETPLDAVRFAHQSYKATTRNVHEKQEIDG